MKKEENNDGQKERREKKFVNGKTGKAGGRKKVNEGEILELKKWGNKI